MNSRVIKKYPNRRLYDTAASRYITLNDVRELVFNGTPFAVIENRTGATITRSILLQVIADLEQRGEPVMSEESLVEIIRAHRARLPVAINRS